MASSDGDDSFDLAMASIDLPTESPKRSKPSPPSTSSSTQPTIPPPSITKDKQPSPLHKVASSSYNILVHPKQRGNPILKSITAVPWEFCDILPDYVVGPSSCVLFLSLKYHNLNPDYIHNRLKLLGKNFELRVLLVQVDTKEPHNSLKHLTRMCFLADLTLMLAWNAQEAGRIVETYKMFENKPPDLIMERAEQAPHQKVIILLALIPYHLNQLFLFDF